MTGEGHGFFGYMLAGMQRTQLRFILLIVLVSIAGCSAGPKKRFFIDGDEMVWSEMDVAQRKHHMEQVVLPIAGSVFRSWRPGEYDEIGCSLCHGAGAASDDFRMPTTHLPRLSGELFLGREFRDYPETTGLKLDRLVPEMAAALGKDEFSLITRRGFGCYSCHLGPDGPMFGN
jgi:hypothetical protein